MSRLHVDWRDRAVRYEVISHARILSSQLFSFQVTFPASSEQRGGIEEI